MSDFIKMTKKHFKPKVICTGQIWIVKLIEIYEINEIFQ